MYHVSLDLSDSQVKQVKKLALERDTTVKGFVTGLVTKELENAEGKVKKEEKSKPK